MRGKNSSMSFVKTKLILASPARLFSALFSIKHRDAALRPLRIRTA